MADASDGGGVGGGGSGDGYCVPERVGVSGDRDAGGAEVSAPTEKGASVVTTWEDLEDKLTQLMEFHSNIVELVEDCLYAVSDRDHEAFAIALRRYNAAKPPAKFKVGLKSGTGGKMMN
jgi:hypothetical protein